MHLPNALTINHVPNESQGLSRMRARDISRKRFSAFLFIWRNTILNNPSSKFRFPGYKMYKINIEGLKNARRLDEGDYETRFIFVGKGKSGGGKGKENRLGRSGKTFEMFEKIETLDGIMTQNANSNPVCEKIKEKNYERNLLLCCFGAFSVSLKILQSLLQKCGEFIDHKICTKKIYIYV